jgi:hypothetical protein
VCEDKLLLPYTGKRKPYKQPVVTKIDREEARWLLQTYADVEDESTRKLLRRALIDPEGAGKKQETEGKRDVRVPQPSIFRRIVFAAAVCFMLVVPLTLLIAAVSAGSALQAALAKMSPLWFPVWAAFTLWVTLDASALYGFAGPRPDPFGPKALSMSALGIANIVSMTVFLFLVKGRY